MAINLKNDTYVSQNNPQSSLEILERIEAKINTADHFSHD
jgi:hypothetical protein